jgi:hypothetical protein
MDQRSLLRRFLEDDFLRWQAVAVNFVLFCMVVGYIILAENTLPPLSILWLGIVALQFIFTFSNEDRREKAGQPAGKPKHHRLELTDDGEIVEVVEDEEKGKSKLL